MGKNTVSLLVLLTSLIALPSPAHAVEPFDWSVTLRDGTIVAAHRPVESARVTTLETHFGLFSMPSSLIESSEPGVTDFGIHPQVREEALALARDYSRTKLVEFLDRSTNDAPGALLLLISAPNGKPGSKEQEAALSQALTLVEEFLSLSRPESAGWRQLCLFSGQSSIRKIAEGLLPKFGNAEQLLALLPGLRLRKLPNRPGLASALGRLAARCGEASISDALRILGERRSRLWLSFVEALGRRVSLQILTNSLNECPSVAARRILQSLRDLRGPYSTSEIVSYYQMSENLRCKQLCLSALGASRSAESIELLGLACGSADKILRGSACSALKRLTGISFTSPDAGRLWVEAHGDIPEQIAQLPQNWRDAKTRSAKRALLKSLGPLRDHEYHVFLAQVAGSKENPTVRAEAIRALASSGDQSSTAFFIGLLTEKEILVRRAALAGLQSIHGRRLPSNAIVWQRFIKARYPRGIPGDPISTRTTKEMP